MFLGKMGSNNQEKSELYDIFSIKEKSKFLYKKTNLKGLKSEKVREFSLLNIFVGMYVKS